MARNRGRRRLKDDRWFNLWEFAKHIAPRQVSEAWDYLKIGHAWLMPQEVDAAERQLAGRLKDEPADTFFLFEDGDDQIDEPEDLIVDGWSGLIVLAPSREPADRAAFKRATWARRHNERLIHNQITRNRTALGCASTMRSGSSCPGKSGRSCAAGVTR